MSGKEIKDVKISVAFRFHTNLYHSYRTDSLDENGIGKDIRLSMAEQICIKRALEKCI